MGSADTYRCCTCWGTLCEVSVFCYDEFRSGGYLWGCNSYTVTVTLLQVGFGLACSCTGLTFELICKMNSYLC